MRANPKALLILGFVFGAMVLASCSDQDKVSVKLAAYYEKYNQAKELIIERNYKTNNPISREEWETVLSVSEDMRLSQSDIETIKKNHNKIIEDNHKRAVIKSEIALDPLRYDRNALGEFCHQIPKGGMLHVHPYGLLSRNVVTELLEKYNPVITPEYFITTINNNGQKLYDPEIETLRSLPSGVEYASYSDQEKKTFIDMFFLPRVPESHDFTRFDAIFAFVIWLVEDEYLDEKMEVVYRNFLQSEAAEGLSYVEFTNGYPPTLESIEKLENWSDMFLKETGVTVRWNMGQLRFLPGKINADMIKAWNTLLVEHPSDVIVGTDLYAIERGNPALEKAQEAYGYLSGFNAEHENHPLQMTMHAGELGDPHNVRDAMLMGVSRVGHGVLLDQDIITLEYARREKLAVEMNIISNHQLTVHNMNNGSHPFVKFLRLGLPVSLSTDNNAIFDTSISKECIAAVSTTDITYAELKQMSLNSIETSFAKNDVKQSLIKSLNEKFMQFEANYNN